MKPLWVVYKDDDGKYKAINQLNPTVSHADLEYARARRRWEVSCDKAEDAIGYAEAMDL